MSRIAWLLAVLAICGAVGASAGACNSGTGDCPAKEAIQPGASCDDDQLQCAYDLSTPSAACDGTTTVIPSSCICTTGAWSCPSAFTCGDDDGTNPATGDDGSSPDASGDDGPGDDGSSSG